MATIIEVPLPAEVGCGASEPLPLLTSRPVAPRGPRAAALLLATAALLLLGAAFPGEGAGIEMYVAPLAPSASVMALRAEGPSEKAIDALSKLEEAERKSVEATKNPSGSMYIDDLPDIKSAELSRDMKRKLRAEYLALGGSTSKAMGANYFLWISVTVAVLAVLTWLSGGCATGL
eukprot:TRINITY_DN9878_c0_g1_i1.p1 TRINITY_DN9878_c0_g1~~TRINITY_DN9878_c0_g1_i1.p1  ORF type:complete len:186 (-),score=57.13 TRINITY_DN9878_c0_g1_i1:297-824(-)